MNMLTIERLQGKTDRILEHLKNRELERNQIIQLRKDDKLNLDAENEKIDYFEESFRDRLRDIEDLIEKSADINEKDRAEHFNKIYTDLLILQKYVASSNLFLRTYDVKRYQETIADCTKRCKELEAVLIPKKKFNFRNRSKTKDVVDVAPIKKVPPLAPLKVVLDDNFCGFKDTTDSHLVLSRYETLKKDVMLQNLTNCVVRVCGAPSTLHLNNITNCIILSGPVQTSVFADTCVNSTLALSCQQLRLHSSKNVKIYLHVTSRAIMEDCTQISIAPNKFEYYPDIDQDFKTAGLRKDINNWNCIDDFNWLHLEKKSPNWSVLPEDERITDWNVYNNFV